MMATIPYHRKQLMDTLAIIRPDDWHVHFRDGVALKHTVADMTRVFARAIAMPNLKPPVTTVAQALDYRQRILEARPENSNFQPLMTLYLTDNTTPKDIEEAASTDVVVAAKLYPAGATTNSDSGVTDLSKLDNTLAAMAETGILLLVHGEVTRESVDIFDRETVFIGEQLTPLIDKHPKLKVVFEHITTRSAVEFVMNASHNVGATITAHHLLLNRNDMLVGGIKPHLYCLPVLKTEGDREALLEAATSGEGRFFLGTDSAPHARHAKEAACGCAGTYTAHAALELYAEAFDSVGALEQLEAFASLNGPRFYGLKPNSDHVTLIRKTTDVPGELSFGDDVVVPLRANESVAWTAQIS